MKVTFSHFGEGTIAEVTMSDLHNLFSDAHMTNNPEDEGDYPIEEYRMVFSEEDELNDEQKAEASRLCGELNSLVAKYRELNDQFHDLFDCR